MKQSLYYCMSNTQLRKIIYACGKSQQAKNKAAAVLRLRKTLAAKQQVSLSGYSYTFNQERFILIPNTTIQSITRKTKGYLKQGTQQISRSLNFSTLTVESAGSLSLQGRTPLQPYRSISFKGNKYQRGVRRKVITRPRQRFEVPEDVPRTVEAVQPARQEVTEKQTQIHENTLATKNCEGGQSCGLDLERAVDPKPVSAYLKTIARYVIYGVTGLICLPILITAILILLPILIKVLIIIIRVALAILILISPFLLVWYVLKSCYNCCRRRTVEEDLQYQRQQIMNNWKPKMCIDRFGNRVNF